MRSGVAYSTFSVQGRFLAYGLQIREVYEYNTRRWLSSRLLDMIHVCSLGTVDQTNAKQFMDKLHEIENTVFEIADPFKRYKISVKQMQQKDDEAKQQFIKALSESRPDGFGSLAEIKKNMKKLAATVSKQVENT